jgi:glyoxylase-like metal-dependent hydrolase (beta-lactamase superfamily II)
MKPGSMHLVGALLALVFSCCGAGLARAADAYSATPLAEHVFQVAGPRGNTLVAVDTDGLILIDGVPAAEAAGYWAFVQNFTGESRVKALVVSHWHAEVNGLNALAVAAGAELIAHDNTRQWLAATIRRRGDTILHRPVPVGELPTRVFHDTLSLPFRDGSMELGWLLHAHTDGDLYALFPGQHVLYTGPAVRTDAWSTVDEATNGFVGGLTDAYDKLARQITGETRIVPFSGPVIDQAAFAEQAALYKKLMQEMVALLRQSRSADEVVAANPAIGLKPEWGDASAFLDEGFRSFYGHLRETRHVGIMP